MSKRKYLIKLYKKCILCDGTGKRYESLGDEITGESFFCGGKVKCNWCKGIGQAEIIPNSSNFKKLYIKELKRIIALYYSRVADVKQMESSLMKDIKTHCKELDKIINKP